ncbi:MAG: CHASE3 domain-containing protein, partial [Bacteroidota bacterium]
MVLKLTADKILTATILLLLAAVAVILLVSLSHSKQVNETAKLVEHTQDVIISSEKVLSFAVSNETASRGFAVAGKQDFLITMNEAKEATYKEFANLKALTADN